MKIIYKYIIFIIQDISIIPRATNVVGRADQINSKLGQKCSSQRRAFLTQLAVYLVSPPDNVRRSGY